jgi:hypothetical protein
MRQILLHLLQSAIQLVNMGNERGQIEPLLEFSPRSLLGPKRSHTIPTPAM